MSDRARSLRHSPPGQGFAPDTANASRHAKKFRVPLTVLELVKQKIAGPCASGVGSDFVIDDGTGKRWVWWLVSRSEANHLQDGFLLFTKLG